MSKPTTVSISALRTSVTRVLDEVQQRHGDEVDLATDFYWVLPASSAYDLDVTPTAAVHTVGSLVDDLDTVAQLAAGQGEENSEEVGDEGGDSEIVAWHDLTHLVGVLARLAALDQP